MHELARRVLSQFQARPHAELDTTHIVQEVFSEQMRNINKGLASTDQETRKQAKREKSRLHRKLLYHLGKLEEHRILRVARMQSHGEKVYALHLPSGELHIADKSERVTITKHRRAESFIEEESAKGHVVWHAPEHHLIEAYALHARHYPRLTDLLDAALDVKGHLADALGLIGMEQYLDENPQQLQETLQRFAHAYKDFSGRVTLHFDLTRTELRRKDAAALSALLRGQRVIYLIFRVDDASVRANTQSLGDIMKQCATHHKKFNLQHARYTPPVLMGRSGCFLLTDKQHEMLQHACGLIVCSKSLALDMKRIGSQSAAEYAQLCTRMLKTLLAHTALQRRVAHTNLYGLSVVDELRAQFATPTLYIRVWNAQADTEDTRLLLAELREHLAEQAQLHRRVFAACGVPLDFEVHLSSAFVHYGDLSPRAYKKLPVKGTKTMPEEWFVLRERLLEAFDVDRVRIFREEPFSAEQLLKEIATISDKRRFPLTTYDFAHLPTTMSLERFL